MSTNTIGQPRNFIKLNPPLPFTAQNLGHGFVKALAADSFVLNFMEQPTAYSLNNLSGHTVTISVSDNRSFKFSDVKIAYTENDGQCLGSISPRQSDTSEKSQETETSVRSGNLLNELISHIRKDQHISICAHEDVEASDRYTGFADINLKPSSFPEMAWNDLDTQSSFLGRTFSSPLLITGMTGGLSRGTEINRRLALAAEKFDIPMGVGSQRIAIENPELAKIFAVKRTAPHVFLIGNLGLSQLAGGRPFSDAKDMMMRAIEMIDADAMAFHINVLQELIQVEGDRDFRSLISLLAKLIEVCPVPVMVKEVGCGIDAKSALLLKEAGVSAIDVGGKGGTSWSYIEGQRAVSEETKSLATTFRDFGVPTAIALDIAHSCLPSMPLVATGGIRNGLDAAKAIGLGATMVGVGLPLLRAALESETGPQDILAEYSRGIKTAMMCSSAQSLEKLPLMVRKSTNFKNQLEMYL